MKNLKTIIVISVCVLIFSGCADVSEVKQCLDNNPYGFWGGLWHGMVSPISFIGSLIWDDISMYAVNNNGGWYDFGFVLGSGIIGGGIGRSSK